MSISDKETKNHRFMKEFKNIWVRGFLNPHQKKILSTEGFYSRKSIACPSLIWRRRIFGKGRNLKNIWVMGFLSPFRRRSYPRCDSTLEKSIACPSLIRRRRIVGSGRNLRTSEQGAFSTPSCKEDPISKVRFYSRKVHRMSVSEKETQDRLFRKQLSSI
jgi:hypothetical protein